VYKQVKTISTLHLNAKLSLQIY